MNLHNLFAFLFLFAEEEPQNQWLNYVLIGVIAVAFVLVMVIPNRRNKKKAEEMKVNLKVGVKITTIGGIIGTVIEIDEQQNLIYIETGHEDNKTVMCFTRNAIYSIHNPAAEADKQKLIKDDTDEIK